LLAPFAGQQANRMAQQLLGRFGGLSGLFHAEANAIEGLIGRRPDIALQLTLLGDLVRETLRDRAHGMTVFPTPQAVLDFVRFDMLGRRRETLRILYLDGGNHLLSDDIIAEGTVSSLTFHPREVLRRAIEVNASAMILVHNHPSSPPHASAEDIAATQCTARLAAELGIILHDHLIIARGGWCSLRAEGHV
jgi:DNA repair protein RadC